MKQHKFSSVLIIDDDEINNFLCKEIIKEVSFADQINTCTSAARGLKFIERAYQEGKDSLPELIFLDINMPVMDGWGFVKEFSNQFPELRDQIVIVILSSSVYDKDYERAESLPEVKEFISKPLTQDVLALLLERYCKAPSNV